LFEEIAKRSNVQIALDDHSYDITKVNQENRRQADVDKALELNLKNLADELETQRNELIKMQNDSNSKFDRRIKSLEELTGEHSSKIKTC